MVGPQEKPREGTIPVQVPGFGVFYVWPEQAVMYRAALRAGEGSEAVNAHIARVARLTSSRIADGTDPGPSKEPVELATLVSRGLVTSQDLADAGISLGIINRTIAKYRLGQEPPITPETRQHEAWLAARRAEQEAKTPEPRTVVAGAGLPTVAPREEPKTMQERLADKGLLQEFEALERESDQRRLAQVVPPTPPADVGGIQLAGDPGSVAVREQPEITPENLPKHRLSLVERLNLASSSQTIPPPTDTVALPIAAENIPKLTGSVQSEFAQSPTELVVGEEPVGGISGELVSQFVQPPTELVAGKEPIGDISGELVSQFAQVASDTVPIPEPIRFRPEIDPAKMTLGGPEIVHYIDTPVTPTTPPVQNVGEVAVADDPTPVGAPPQTAIQAYAERTQNREGLSLKDRLNLSVMGTSVTSDLNPAELKRVAKEMGVNKYDLAASLAYSPMVSPAEIPFSSAFSRGLYSGLRRYAQIFGADPDPASRQLPSGLTESGLARFFGEAVAATPAFITGSIGANIALGSLGVSARLTPLTYSLTRSAFTGATLGVLRTEVGEDFEWGDLAKNMIEEAAIWTTFDAGILLASGKMASMARAGRDIRQIRSQLKGGREFVNPYVLEVEQAVFYDAARDYRSVANRIHSMFMNDAKDPLAVAAGLTSAHTEAFGVAIVDGLETSAIRSIEEQVLQALPEGFSATIHNSKRVPGMSSLLVLDDARHALGGATIKQRIYSKVLSMPGRHKFTGDQMVDLLRLGLADEGTLPLKVIKRRAPEGTPVLAEYSFQFGKSGLKERRLDITLPANASADEVVSALSHELMHDIVILKTGRPPGPNLIAEVFGRQIGDTANFSLKGGKRTWLREMRAVQRELFARKYGKTEGLKRIRESSRHLNEYELAADVAEFAALDVTTAERLMPTIFKQWAETLSAESHLLKAALRGESLLTEGFIKRFAEQFGRTIDDVIEAEGITRFKNVFVVGDKLVERSVTIQRRKLTQAMAKSIEDAKFQFREEGVYEGMRVFYKGQIFEAVRGYPSANRMKIRTLDQHRKVYEVPYDQVQRQTLQGNVKYSDQVSSVIDSIIKGGFPRTIGINVHDRMGGVARAIIRTKDLLYVKGSRDDALALVSKHFGDDALKGLDAQAQNSLISQAARLEGRKGVLLDEEGLITIIADNLENEVAIHYSRIAPEMVDVVHGAGDGAYTLGVKEVIEESLYQAGIPLREVSKMAEFAMKRKTFQFRDLIDDDFNIGNVAELWDDVLKGVEFFDEAGMRTMRHNGGRVTINPDGSYNIVINDGVIPGGVIAAVKDDAEQAFRYVNAMAPRPGAPDLARGIPFPEELATHINPRGGTEPFKFGETLEARVTPDVIDDGIDADQKKFRDLIPSSREEATNLVSQTMLKAGEVARSVPGLTSARALFMEYEKRGFGPVFSEIFQKSQQAIIDVKNAMASERLALGTRGKSGKAHSFLTRTKEYQREIQRVVRDPARRRLITQYAMAVDQKTLIDTATIMGRPLNDTERAIIKHLEDLQNRLVNPQDITKKIPKLISNYLSGSRDLANKQKYLAQLEASLKGTPSTPERYNLAQRLIKFRNNPEAMTLDDYLYAMGHTREEVEVIGQIGAALSKGEEVNLFGISRYFSAGKMDKKAFAAAHNMTAEEIKLAQDLKDIIAESIRAADETGAVDGAHEAEVFLTGIFPEVKNFVEQGFPIDDKIIKRFFGNHADFLHQRMVAGDIDVYARDPAYLAWRVVRGKLMQKHWDPVMQKEISPAMDELLALSRDRSPSGVPVEWNHVSTYLNELQGVPHESFAKLEHAVMGMFEKMGLYKHVDPALFRDLLQRMNMGVYKATIPMRPALLLRNAAEIYRVGGVTGGKSLGWAVQYVTNPKTMKKAIHEARMAGALKPDLPVFTVDPTVRGHLRALGGEGNLGKIGLGAQKTKRALHFTAQHVDDVVERGMGWYQRVDEYSRAVAYHAMQHRISSNMRYAANWEQFLTKAKIRTFEEPEQLNFAKLWQEGRQKEAIDYLSVAFADKTLFLYGNANHPIGWGSTYGVLFGQFGTWPVQYKDWIASGLTRGTFKDKVEFAAWNFVVPAYLVAEGRKVGLDFNGWWGVSSLRYTGGPFMDMSIDLTRAFSGSDAERAMARASLRRNSPITQPYLPNVFLPLSFAANDIIEIASGRKSPWNFVVKQIPPTE